MITLTILLIAIPIILIIALFVRKGFKVEREILIKKPGSEVFNYIRFLKNQDNFNKWVMTDPNRKKEFTGTDGTVGFIYSWESKNVKAGKAAQEIIKINEPQKIDIEIRFEKPFVSKGYTSMEVESIAEGESRVKWLFEGNPTPYYKLRVAQLLFMLKRKRAKDMQAGLLTLKGILEK